VRHREQRVHHLVVDVPVGALELPLQVDGELGRRDQLELEHLRAAVEGLVLVGEEALHHVALAAGVDVRDLGLLLEHRAHQRRQPRVDVGHLLELVEDHDHLALALRGELRRQLEQPLERRVDVLAAVARRKREARLARRRVDGDGRVDAQRREDAQPLLRVEER
jgi:hypothetical protein